MNTSIPKDFVYTPFELIFGRSPFTAIDALYNLPTNEVSVDNWAVDLFKARDAADL
jgi:hypothetical protein